LGGEKEKSLLGIPIKLSANPGEIKFPPPKLGQDTDPVLRALGFSVAELKELLSSTSFAVIDAIFHIE